MKPRRIIVENEALDYPLAGRLLEKFAGLPTVKVDRADLARGRFSRDELLIAVQRGGFVKKCPGTPGYACCDYYVIKLGIGCFFNCTYCYLHHYMNTPFTVYVNTEDLIAEVKEVCAKQPQKIFRLGSGEFIDSLGFDELAPINRELIPALAPIENLVFEIKTKSVGVEPLLRLAHPTAFLGRTVIAWSVNPQEIIATEETGAAGLKERLKAAGRCREAGYRIGFHFDPLIHFPGWQAAYEEVVDLIFAHVDPEDVAWISLGALRFNPALKPIMKRAFPASRLPYGELVPGLDGKLRYFMGIRKPMFKAVIDRIRRHSDKVPVYLCMESKALARELGAIQGFSLTRPPFTPIF